LGVNGGGIPASAAEQKQATLRNGGLGIFVMD